MVFVSGCGRNTIGRVGCVVVPEHHVLEIFDCSCYHPLYRSMIPLYYSIARMLVCTTEYKWHTPVLKKPSGFTAFEIWSISHIAVLGVGPSQEIFSANALLFGLLSH